MYRWYEHNVQAEGIISVQGWCNEVAMTPLKLWKTKFNSNNVTNSEESKYCYSEKKINNNFIKGKKKTNSTVYTQHFLQYRIVKNTIYTQKCLGQLCP